VFFSFSTAWGFTLNSSSNPNFKGWPSPTIQFAINPTNCPASVQGLMESAFDIWREVATSKVELRLVGSTTSTTFGNPTTVYCSTNFAAESGGSDEDSVPAVAAVTPPGGEYATGGVLILNVSSGAANISNFNATIVRIVIAHEVGHILGLGHSHDTSALMYYDASAKGTLRLGQDDIDGISYLYNRNELSGDDPFGGCGLVKKEGPPSSNNLAALLFLMCLPFLFAFALRNKRASIK
jgi:type 1 fimbria pilin